MTSTQTWYFTFGFGHPNAGRFVVVRDATHEDARARMVEAFGQQWAFQYSESQWSRDGVSQAEQYGLTEIELVEGESEPPGFEGSRDGGHGDESEPGVESGSRDEPQAKGRQETGGASPDLGSTRVTPGSLSSSAASQTIRDALTVHRDQKRGIGLRSSLEDDALEALDGLMADLARAENLLLASERAGAIQRRDEIIIRVEADLARAERERDEAQAATQAAIWDKDAAEAQLKLLEEERRIGPMTQRCPDRYCDTVECGPGYKVCPGCHGDLVAK